MERIVMELGTPERRKSEIPKELTDVLSQMPYFSGAEKLDEFIECIGLSMRTRFYESGEMIIKQGDQAKAIFFILKGTVTVTSHDSEIDFAELGAGSFFGEISVFFNMTRTANVKSNTKCTIALLADSVLQTSLDKFPQIRQIMYKTAEERLNLLQEGLKNAGRGLPTPPVENLFDSGKASGRRQSMTMQTAGFHRPSIAYELSSPLASPVEDENADEEDDTLQEYEAPVLQQRQRKSSLSPTTRVVGSAIRNRLEEKRRASVAVWSDNKLMLVAQKIAGSKDPKSPAGRRLQGAGSHSLLEKDENDLIDGDNNVDNSTFAEKEKFAFDRIPAFDKLLKYLTFAEVFALRRINKSLFNRIQSDAQTWLSKIDLSLVNKKVDNSVVASILFYCGKTVEHLNLKNCWLVDDHGLLVIGQCCPGLKTLSLASVWEITDDGLCALADSNRLLTTIDLANCRKVGDRSVCELLQKCTLLTDINLSYCKNLSDNCLGDVKACSKFKVLNLQRCTGVTDAGFVNWASFTPTLAQFDNRAAAASNLAQIETDSTTSLLSFHTANESFIDLPTVPSSSVTFDLSVLYLSDCSFLTCKALRVIATVCPQLVVLSLSFCCSLTEDFASLLVGGCKALKALELSFCGAAVTDAALEALAKRLPRLQALGFRGCVQVTEQGVNALRASASLDCVNLSQCKELGPGAREKYGQFWRLVLSENVCDVFLASMKPKQHIRPGFSPAKRNTIC